jgi:leucyl-tRNA synthetase
MKQDDFSWLQKWYYLQCDGDWEHTYGIDLKTLENSWPSQVLTMQENWIGRSEGLEFKFDVTKETRAKLDKMFANFSVFTTRPDTIYGVSYTALSPEHPIVKYILEKELLPKNKLYSYCFS